MRAPVRFSIVSCLAGALLWGCATPSPSTTGTAGSTGAGNTSGSAGTTGGGNTSGSAGTTGGGNTSGSAGTTGGGNTSGTAGSSATGTAGTGGPACTVDPNNLVTPGGWICAKDMPIMIQGAFYGYTDGMSCMPASNICSGTRGCCISGTTVPFTSTNNRWGCGMGMELNSSGGTPAVKSVYAGPVKCFDITLSGSSGNNVVRIGITQAGDNTGKVAPFVEIGKFGNGWTGRVCFDGVECPSWATAAQCMKTIGSPGTPYDLQIQVSAGEAAATTGAFDVCLSSIKPITDPGGTGSTNSCPTVTGGPGTITDQYGRAHVTCGGKDYMVQNNAWGQMPYAGQTITYGVGTKFKVTAQQGTGQNNNPASYPSLWTGANSGVETQNPGLPRPVSQINAGSMMTSWTWTANGASGNYNAAYDVWFATSNTKEMGASSPSGGFLMVWLYDPPQMGQPIGTNMGSRTVGGRTWNVWFGNQAGTNKPCVSYVAQATINSLSFSLGDFIRDAVTLGHVQSGWAVTNVFAGFEIWNGGVGLETTDFSVTVP